MSDSDDGDLGSDFMEECVEYSVDDDGNIKGDQASKAKDMREEEHDRKEVLEDRKKRKRLEKLEKKI